MASVRAWDGDAGAEPAGRPLQAAFSASRTLLTPARWRPVQTEPWATATRDALRRANSCRQEAAV